MRVSSLSDDRIIRLISGTFVPGWVSRDNYQLPDAGKDDKALLAKIDASRRAKKLESGTVCVYIADHKGEVLATLPVQKACKPELLRAFLDKIILDENLKPRTRAIAQASAEQPARAKGRNCSLK